MLLSGRNGDRISSDDVAHFGPNPNSPYSGGNIVYFLRFWMVMFLRASAGLNPRFGEALVSNDGIPISQQFANFGAIFRLKRRHLIQISDIHVVLLRSRGDYFLFVLRPIGIRQGLP